MPKRAQYAKPMRDMGILEPNRKIEGAHSPDYVGEVVIDDVPYRMSIWNDAKDRKTVSVQRMADWT